MASLEWSLRLVLISKQLPFPDEATRAWFFSYWLHTQQPAPDFGDTHSLRSLGIVNDVNLCGRMVAKLSSALQEPLPTESSDDHEKVGQVCCVLLALVIEHPGQRDFHSVNTRELATSWSTKSNTTESSSSDLDCLNEALPVISLVPPTPRGSVGSPALPPDSPITLQKFVRARSDVLLKRRSSFMSSPPPLVVAPCSVCSRPDVFIGRRFVL
ncbi:hypothetical protein BJ322DRAFT_574424 [Thelephora terrestris]|uniref:Uncharacterized protein n=1 Tax=Thelephora terrestris TaxID=56493 RepID=A0A9P6H334_9AGAM|nr:hypothetical protein BJ322DRAFT_574424 [Thelephora terrestris]